MYQYYLIFTLRGIPVLIDSISIDLEFGICLLSTFEVLLLSISSGLMLKFGNGGGGGALGITFRLYS
jgi:hypothetical protein